MDYLEKIKNENYKNIKSAVSLQLKKGARKISRRENECDVILCWKNCKKGWIQRISATLING